MRSEKRQKQGSALIFASFHLAFVLHLYHESTALEKNKWVLLLLAPLPFYVLLPFQRLNISMIQLFPNILMFFIGFICTLFMEHYFSPVASAAACASIFVLISELKALKISGYQSVLYCGVFAGMTGPHWLENPYSIPLSSLIGGLVFTLFTGSLNGFGGKMGTIGFTSVIFWIVTQW